MNPSPDLLDHLERFHTPDPTTREILAKEIGDGRLDDDTAAWAVAALFARALVDEDEGVASCAFGSISRLQTLGCYVVSHACLRPIIHWWRDPQARHAISWGAKIQNDPWVWQRLILELMDVVELEVGTISRSNALSALLRLVQEQRLSDAGLLQVAEGLQEISFTHVDDEMIAILDVCLDLAPMACLIPNYWRSREGPAAQALADRLESPGALLPRVRLPKGWHLLPVAERPPEAVNNPLQCSACARVHTRPVLLCEKCRNWAFVPAGILVPTPNPPPSVRPEPPRWAKLLRGARRRSPVVRVPRS